MMNPLPFAPGLPAGPISATIAVETPLLLVLLVAAFVCAAVFLVAAYRASQPLRRVTAAPRPEVPRIEPEPAQALDILRAAAGGGR